MAKVRIIFFLCTKRHKCYSTVACKVLLNRLHGKLGQYWADSLPNLENVKVLRSFCTMHPPFEPTCSVSSPDAKERDLP